MSKKVKASPSEKSDREEREERLSAALRANLRRRKAAARANKTNNKNETP